MSEKMLTPDEQECNFKTVRESVKQALREAMQGEYVSLETLWSDDIEEIEAELHEE